VIVFVAVITFTIVLFLALSIFAAIATVLWALAGVTALLVGCAFAVSSTLTVIAALANFVFAAVATTAGTAVTATLWARATFAVFTTWTQ
jgi:hypothetical protein